MMDHYKETFETWNKVADLYQNKFMDLDLYNETYDFFCKSLAIDKISLLEIGCGPGNITRYLLSKKPTLQILGIDIAPNMIALAQKNNPSARFEVMDSRAMEQLEARFDGIVAGFCVPYLSESDCLKLIMDSNALLTEGGIIYLSFVAGDPQDSGFQVGSSGDRTYFYYHSLDNMTQMLTQNHFEMLQTFNIPYKKNDGSIETHTVLIAKKMNS